MSYVLTRKELEQEIKLFKECWSQGRVEVLNPAKLLAIHEMALASLDKNWPEERFLKIRSALEMMDCTCDELPEHWVDQGARCKRCEALAI